MPQIHSCNIISAPVSDHRVVVLEMGTEINQRGPVYWKLNVSYLEDSEYITKITELIKSTLLEYDAVEDKRIIWDLMKVLIKEYSIKHSQIKASERKQKTLEIEKQIEILDNSLLKNNSSTFVIKKEELKRNYQIYCWKKQLEHKFDQGLNI